VKPMQLEKVNLELSGHDGLTACLSCEYNRARFHVWGQVKDGQLVLTGNHGEGSALYKNCPRGLKRGEPGHYDARKLRKDSQHGAALITAMLREVRGQGLLVFARRALADKEQARHREQALLRREHRIMEAAPDMFAALVDVLGDLEHYAVTHGPGPDVRLARVQAILDRINTDPDA